MNLSAFKTIVVKVSSTFVWQEYLGVSFSVVLMCETHICKILQIFRFNFCQKMFGLVVLAIRILFFFGTSHSNFCLGILLIRNQQGPGAPLHIFSLTYKRQSGLRLGTGLRVKKPQIVSPTLPIFAVFFSETYLYK